MQRFTYPPEIGFQTGRAGLQPDRPSLLFIHGAGGSAQSFFPQIRRLDRHLNVLALDLPGHGRTPGPGMTSIADYGRWVHQTLIRLPVRNLFLCGHSMGGAISLELALEHPGRFRGLILIGTAAPFHLPPETLSGLRSDSASVLDRINRQCYAEGTSQAILAQSLRLLRQTSSETIYGDFLACSRFQRQADLGQLNSPTLILVGAQDELTPPSSAALLNKSLPDSRLITIPGAGHMVMLEKPGLVNPAVRDFIEARGC